MAKTDVEEDLSEEMFSSAVEVSDLRCTEHINGKGFPDSPELGPRVFPREEKVPRTIVDINQPVRAYTDWTLIRDDRVLQNLLKLEERYMPATPDYFRFIQTEVTPSMRKIVADWMLQVCQEVQCQPEVFCLAMNYMDRFLARCRVTKSRLQLVGAVCLLVSSKFKETCPIPGEKLIFYTDYSITADELKDWELLILQELKWELSSVSPLDYLDQIIARVGLSPDLDIMDLKRRTETIIVLAITEYRFSYLNPSLLAITALYTALKYFYQSTNNGESDDGKDLTEVKTRLLAVTNSQMDDIELCMEQILQLVPSYLISYTPSERACPSTPSPSADSAIVSTSPECQTTSTSSVASSPTTSGLVGDFQSNLKPDLTDSYSILVS